MPETAYAFDPVTSTYSGPSGGSVPTPITHAVLDRTLQSGAQATRSLTEGLVSGNLSLQQWRAAMAAEIKASQLAAAAVARGGFAQMSQADYGWVGQRTRAQYRYLRDFTGQLAAGQQALDGRALSRAEMYAEAARGTHREMERRLGRQAGHNQEKSELGPADHCRGCRREARRGWVAIGALVAVGARDCLTRCHCTIRTRRDDEAATATAETRRDIQEARADESWQQRLEREEQELSDPNATTPEAFGELLRSEHKLGRRATDEITAALDDMARQTHASGVEVAQQHDARTGVRADGRPTGTHDSISAEALQPIEDWITADADRRSASYAFLHTHPNSSAFSPADVATLLRDQQQRTAIVRGQDGSVYAMSRTPESRRLAPTDADVERVWNEELELLQPRYQQRVNDGESPIVAWQETTDHIWQRAAPRLGLRYDSIRPSGG